MVLRRWPHHRKGHRLISGDQIRVEFIRTKRVKTPLFASNYEQSIHFVCVCLSRFQWTRCRVNRCWVSLNVFICQMFRTLTLCLWNRRFCMAEIAVFVVLNTSARISTISGKTHVIRVTVVLNVVLNLPKSFCMTRDFKGHVLCLSVLLDMAKFRGTTISFNCVREIHISSFIFLNRRVHFKAM